MVSGWQYSPNGQDARIHRKMQVWAQRFREADTLSEGWYLPPDLSLNLPSALGSRPRGRSSFLLRAGRPSRSPWAQPLPWWGPCRPSLTAHGRARLPDGRPPCSPSGVWFCPRGFKPWPCTSRTLCVTKHVSAAHLGSSLLRPVGAPSSSASASPGDSWVSRQGREQSYASEPWVCTLVPAPTATLACGVTLEPSSCEALILARTTLDSFLRVTSGDRALTPLGPGQVFPGEGGSGVGGGLRGGAPSGLLAGRASPEPGFLLRV